MCDVQTVYGRLLLVPCQAENKKKNLITVAPLFIDNNVICIADAARPVAV